MSPVNWHDEAAKAAVRRGGAKGAHDWAQDVLSRSQPEVPVSPLTGGGFLKGTGKVTDAPDQMKAAVSYSGPSDKPNLPVWVHELRGISHTTGKPKFLEDPLNADTDSGLERMADALRSELG